MENLLFVKSGVRRGRLSNALECFSAMSNTTKIVVFSVQLAGTMIGNAFLLVLLLKSKQLKRKGSMNLIFNCAVADVFAAMINIPLAMDWLIFNSGNLDGTVAIIVIYSVSVFMALANLNSSLIIIVDRLLVVKFPVKYNLVMTVKKARVAVLMMWLATAIIVIILTTVRFTRNSPTELNDLIEYVQSDGQSQTLIIVSAILFFVCCLTGKLYRELKKFLKTNLSSLSEEIVGPLKASAVKRVINASARTAITMMIIYIFSLVPSLVMGVINDLNITQPIDAANSGFLSLFFCQMFSLLNPLVFILGLPKLRQQVAKMFKNEVEMEVVAA